MNKFEIFEPPTLSNFRRDAKNLAQIVNKANSGMPAIVEVSNGLIKRYGRKFLNYFHNELTKINNESAHSQNN